MDITMDVTPIREMTRDVVSMVGIVVTVKEQEVMEE